jgi:hypothetical protein
MNNIIEDKITEYVSIQIPGSQTQEFINLLNNPKILNDYNRSYLMQVLDQVNTSFRNPENTLYIEFVKSDQFDRLLNWIALLYPNWHMTTSKHNWKINSDGRWTHVNTGQIQKIL